MEKDDVLVDDSIDNDDEDDDEEEVQMKDPDAEDPEADDDDGEVEVVVEDEGEPGGALDVEETEHVRSTLSILRPAKKKEGEEEEEAVEGASQPVDVVEKGAPNKAPAASTRTAGEKLL